MDDLREKIARAIARAVTTTEKPADASGVALTGLLGGTAQERFIDPAGIKTSDWPANIIPAGAIAIDQASEDGDCIVKGFYDPATGEIHIQEVLHNA